MAIFETTYIVGVTDVGLSNKLTNKGIVKILENAAAMHSDKLGYGLNQIEKTKLSWILLNWKVQVLKRPIYNSELRIKTWASGIDKITTCRDFEIYDKDGNIIIIASSKWTLVNIDTKKLELITEDIEERYSPEDKHVFKDFTFKKLMEPENIESISQINIEKRDIDINGHVHNLFYLDYAYEALPEQIENQEFDNIEIMYKKEIKMQDSPVKCNYSNKEGKNIITIKSSDDRILHSIIYLY